MKISLDFETYSEAKIKKVGAYAYAAHPSTEIICLAHLTEECSPGLWVPGQPMPLKSSFPFTVPKHWELWAWSVFFEVCIWNLVGVPKYGFPPIPLTQWRDTMALSAYFGLPQDLFRASQAVDPDSMKDRRGSYLISVLCQPVKPTKKKPFTRLTPENSPELFGEFYAYCKQDTVAENNVHEFLPKQELPEKEQQIWFHNLETSMRGVPIDRPLVQNLIGLRDKHLAILTEEFIEFTGIKPTQVERVRELLDLPNMQAETLEKELTRIEAKFWDDAATSADLLSFRLLKIRLSISKISTKKYDAMLATTEADSRAHGMMVYHGAGTGRYTGRLIQLHNLAQGKFKVYDWDHDFLCSRINLETFKQLYGEPMTALSTLLRGCITASPGKYLYIADFSAIDACCVAWVAGEQYLLDLFHAKEDVYVPAAMDIYGCTLDEIEDDRRALGKVQVLGCGYGMGKELFYETCHKRGVDVPRALANLAVKKYREKNLAIVDLWDKVDTAVKMAIGSPNIIFEVNGKLKIASTGRWLFIKLPSGRTMTYPMPKVVNKKKNFPHRVEIHVTDPVTHQTIITTELQDKWVFMDVITYMGIHSKTHQWTRLDTWGGALVGHIGQGIARDVMCEAQLRTQEAGFDFLFSVHDEPISEDESPDRFEEYLEIMCQVPEWAEGLPISAKGGVYRRYRK